MSKRNRHMTFVGKENDWNWIYFEISWSNCEINSRL